MTSDQSDQPPAPDDATTNPLLDRGQPDDMLELLVDVINSNGGLEIGVTLYVHGTVIDGLLVSGRSYFDLLAEKIGGGAHGPVADALATGFTTRADGYRERERANRDAGDEPEDRPTVYVHLRLATVHAPGWWQPIEQGLWRGRLTSVDGWSMGNFGPKPPLEE